MESDRIWRESCPRLNEFVLKLHQRFTANLKWVQDRLREAKDQAIAAKLLQHTHSEERRRWQDRILDEPGLQGEDKNLEGHVLRPIAILNEHELQRAFRMRHGTHVATAVWGWWPEHLAEQDIPIEQRFHLAPPLGSKNEGEDGIKRGFTDAEIVYALALVHDAHGDFPQLIPSDLREWIYCSFRLISIHRHATDSWAPPLEAWLDRLDIGTVREHHNALDAQAEVLSPTLPEINLEMNQVRYDGHCYDVPGDGALLMSKLVENHPHPISASDLFSKPSRVKHDLPKALQALIVAESGKGYRLRLS